MAEFYVEKFRRVNDCRIARDPPALCRGLLASLLHALEEYKRGLRKMCPASIAGEERALQRHQRLPMEPVDHQEEAEYLREKYL